MLDNLEALEEKVAELISKFKVAQEQIVKLKAENENLRTKLQTYEETEKENQALKSQLKHMEKDSKSWSAKEDEIKNRLTGIISQITSIEQEISSLESDGQK
jgi:DNA repair exonuclease SbcCD ATPase subunit